MNTIAALMKVAENAGYQLRAYSGRGMMGKMCPSIASSDPGMLVGYKLTGALHESLDDVQAAFNEEGVNFMDMLGKARTDNLGYDTVYYFPSIPWEDPDEEPNEEES